jgi:pimeloyl-ACP methyl ester carboxylesterase
MIAKIVKTLATLLALAAVLLTYNAARHLYFHGPTETVTVSSGTISIACTFAKPASDGIFPAVLVLLGSGPETRAGPAYRVNASNMLRHGFAILICDKRGSGDSGGDYATATLAEFAEDAKAAVRYLADRSDLDQGHIGLLANSESGWYSAQVAAETGQVAFIINRVGPPLSWLDTVLWEVRNELLAAGISESDLEALLAVTERRWRFYRDVGRNPQLANGPERTAIDAELERLRTTVPNAAEALPEKARDYDADFYRSYAIDASYEPEDDLRKIDIPLLYVFGGRDVNIPTDDSVNFLEGFKEDYAGSIDILVYPELGHPMVTWRGLFHGGYPPDFLAYVGNWAQSQN